MMLKFEHEGCIVITNSWTASFKNGYVDIAYLWGADAISWFDSATSVRRVNYKCLEAEFWIRAKKGVIDLT